MREILSRAMDPEIHVRIREAVRDVHEVADPVWRDLIQGVDVVLDGESMIVLDGRSIPYDEDLSVLREEAMQLVTSAGRVGIIVDFAQEITASPAIAQVLDQLASRFRRAGESRASPRLLIIVLMLLIAGVLPLVEAALSAKEQVLITNEEASLGLALAVIGLIKNGK